MQQFVLIQQMKLIIRGLHRQLKQLMIRQQQEKELLEMAEFSGLLTLQAN